jgi:hypothetical protein
MGNRGQSRNTGARAPEEQEQPVRLPLATASYRRRAWVQFQRALDPLAPIKPLRPPRF